MESIQWILLESDSPQRQTIEAAHPAVSMQGKQASSENAPSDRQVATADTIYAAFAWLFGSGCF